MGQKNPTTINAVATPDGKMATGATGATEANESEKIAIIGLAGRFPGAQTIAQFWANLCAGAEARATFAAETVAAAVAPDLWQDPAYVNAGFILEQVDQFDADFFDFTPRQAQITDPQQRLFLECVWEALEVAGIDVTTTDQLIGLYAGASQSSYAGNDPAHLQRSMIDGLQFLIGNDKDYLATQTAYRLNLQGPCMTIQTACSTGLVAAHVGCQSLLNRECDVAVAGAVTIRLPQTRGYLYEEGGILAEDGHCRAFDAAASGTVFGNGVGVIVLKRLSDALADGDLIWALIRGSSVNNDGSRKFNFSTSSQLGQVEVISEAWSVADVTPATITYMETHGTGTQVGDPIEVGALATLFADEPTSEKFCTIGSVKPNVGHLETAAGITGLIKTVLALHHRQIPPTINFANLNPEINLASTPFTINTTLVPWATDRLPRRAGVSSFGIGGTNAHLVLEEAPAPAPTLNAPAQPAHLLTISAKSAAAVRAAAARYADFLTTAAVSDLANICYTSHVGRSHFGHRIAVVGDTPQQLQARLAAYLQGEPSRAIQQGTMERGESTPPIAFLFTGQGAQYVNMGRELYETQPTFRALLDQGDAMLRKQLGESILAILYPGKEQRGKAEKKGTYKGAGEQGAGEQGAGEQGAGEQGAGEQNPKGQAKIDATRYTQPALFIFEYALAMLWQTWGIQPDLLLGHSLGELVAACVAGVFGLEDGIKLVAARGRLMDTLPRDGEMIALATDEASVRQAIAPYSHEVAIAAINGPESIVISGKREMVLTIAEQLSSAGIKTSKLTVSHAFHSPAMAPILEEFRKVAATIKYHKAKVRLVSNLTGKVAGAEISTPTYWVQQISQTVRFADGIATLHAQGVGIFLEIGPKATLVGLAEECIDAARQRQSAETKRAPTTALFLAGLRKGQRDWQQLLTSLGEFYVRGAKIDWERVDRDHVDRDHVDWDHVDRALAPRKVLLPTYPFQRKAYWLTNKPSSGDANPVENPMPTGRLNNQTLEVDTAQVQTASVPAHVPAHTESTEANGAAMSFPASHQPAPHQPAPHQIDLASLPQSLQQLIQQHAGEIHLQIDELKVTGLHLHITAGTKERPGSKVAPAEKVRSTATPPHTKVALPQRAEEALAAPAPKRQLPPLTAPVTAARTAPAAVNRGAEALATAQSTKSTQSAQSMADLPMITESLRQLIANILYLEDVRALNDSDKFVDHGMDSVTGVAFINKINRTFDLKLKAVLLYDYSTVSEMAAHIFALLQQKEAVATANGTTDTPSLPTPPTPTDKPISGAERTQLRDILSKVSKRELTPESSRTQLEQIPNNKQRTPMATPQATALDQTQITALIQKHVVEILPALAGKAIALTDTFDALGFDSMEQAEIIIKTIESSGVTLPRIDFAAAKTIGEVVEKIALQSRTV